jgi:hypothetical protein
MTERETVLIREFKEKLERLIELHIKAKEENRMLNEALLEKEACIRELNAQNEELKQRNEHLKIAKSLMGTEEDSHEARIKINKLVREIDHCIAMLNR